MNISYANNLTTTVVIAATCKSYMVYYYIMYITVKYMHYIYS